MLGFSSLGLNASNNSQNGEIERSSFLAVNVLGGGVPGCQPIDSVCKSLQSHPLCDVLGASISITYEVKIIHNIRQRSGELIRLVTNFVLYNHFHQVLIAIATVFDCFLVNITVIMIEDELMHKIEVPFPVSQISSSV